MARRERSQPEDERVDRSTQQNAEGESWDSPTFRNTLLINLAFVVAPAVVMALLRQYTIAAAWVAAGVLVVIWQIMPQIRAFWRALRSSGRGDQDGQE
jgi:hypothetical protein